MEKPINRPTMRRLRPTEANTSQIKNTISTTPPRKMRAKMKKMQKKDEEELKNDFDRTMEDNLTTWMGKTFLNPQVLPPFSSDISIRQLGTIVRDSFLSTVTQPTFTIQAVERGNIWTIQPVDKKVSSPKTFAPTLRSSVVQRRLHTMATFAGLRFMLTSMFAACCRVYALRGTLVHVATDGKTQTVLPEIVISLATKGIWTSSGFPQINVGSKQIPLDKSPGSHLTAWLRCRGGTFLEVDLCDLDLLVTHHATPPTEKMDAMLFLEKTRESAVQQNLVQEMDSLFPEITQRLRRHHKKQKQKRRKKMKRIKKTNLL